MRQYFLTLVQKANVSSYYVRNSVLRVLNVAQSTTSVSTGIQATAVQSTEHTQTPVPEPAPVATSAPAPVSAPEPVVKKEKETGKKSKHQNHHTPAPVVEPTSPEGIVDSVVVLIEDITGQNGTSKTSISGAVGVVTIDDVAEVLAAVAVSSAPAAPKSFADLFKASASEASPVPSGKKNNRSGSGGRPRTTPAAAAPVAEPAPVATAPQPKTQGKQQSTNHSAVFVKQVPNGTPNEDIKALFLAHGPVLKVNINAAGSGFIDFSESNAAAIVLERFTADPSAFSIGGQQLSVAEPSKKAKPASAPAAKGGNSANRGNGKTASTPVAAVADADSSAAAVSGSTGPKNAKKGRASPPNNTQPKVSGNKK